MSELSGLDAVRSSRKNSSGGAREAILDAVIGALLDSGYHALTMEGAARAAQVNKTTLYRWWPGKPALVADALATRMTTGPVPDTGSTRRDLTDWLAGTIANYTGEASGQTIAALIADLTATPGGLVEFRRSFLAERRAGCAQLIARAIARGDVPAHTDVELFMDALAGTVFYRQLVTGLPIDHTLGARIVDLLLRPDVD